MPSRYAQWMYDWEHRLTSVDNNRVVRPLEWGVEWTRDWPCRNGYRLGHTPENPEKLFRDYNRRIVASSDEFFSYTHADRFSTGEARGAGFLHARSSRPEAGDKGQGTFGGISALHLAGAARLIRKIIW